MKSNKSLLSLILCSFLVVGCAGISIPKFIQDANSYKKRIYGDFDEIVSISKEVLEATDWPVEGTMDPSLYEQDKFDYSGKKRPVLIYTEVKRAIGTTGRKYKRVNILVRDVASNSVEIEIRFIQGSSVPMKDFYSYKNDKLSNKLFALIEEKISL